MPAFHCLAIKDKSPGRSDTRDQETRGQGLFLPSSAARDQPRAHYNTAWLKHERKLHGGETPTNWDLTLIRSLNVKKTFVNFQHHLYHTYLEAIKIILLPCASEATIITYCHHQPLNRCQLAIHLRKLLAVTGEVCFSLIGYDWFAVRDLHPIDAIALRKYSLTHLCPKPSNQERMRNPKNPHGLVELLWGWRR